MVGCRVCCLYRQPGVCFKFKIHFKNTEMTVMLLPYLRIPSLPWQDTSSPARCSWKACKHPATGRPRRPGRRSLRCRRHTDRPSCSGWRRTWPLRWMERWCIPLLWCSQTPPWQITTEKQKKWEFQEHAVTTFSSWTRKLFQQRWTTCSNSPQHHDVWRLS